MAEGTRNTHQMMRNTHQFKPVVSYGFTTTAKNHRLLGQTLATFAQGIPPQLMVVATSDALAWAVDAAAGSLPNATAFVTGCREKALDAGRGFDQACKSSALLRRQYAQAPHADWYARVADDCFFVPSHVQKALSLYNPSRFVYAGVADYAWWDLRCKPDMDRNRQCRQRRLFREVHAGGGSLFVFSQALMRWFDGAGARHFLKGGWEMAYNDDVGLGAFLSVVAKAPVIPMPGVFQAPRFGQALIATGRLEVSFTPHTVLTLPTRMRPRYYTAHRVH